MQNAFKNLSYSLQFCPLMKPSNTLKKLEYVPWSKNPWPLQGSGTSQKLCFQKVYNSISQLVYFRSENSHGQGSNCSIRSYYMWCLFLSLIALHVESAIWFKQLSRPMVVHVWVWLQWKPAPSCHWPCRSRHTPKFETGCLQNSKKAIK